MLAQPIYLFLDHTQTTSTAPAWKRVCSPKRAKALSAVRGGGLSNGMKLLEQCVRMWCMLTFH